MDTKKQPQRNPLNQPGQKQEQTHNKPNQNQPNKGNPSAPQKKPGSNW